MSKASGKAGGRPDLFERVLTALTAMPLALILGLTFADVFGRYAFAAPIRGSVEVTEYAMALLIFTALPLVTRARGHVSVSLVEQLVRGKARRVKAVACDAFSAFALALLAWRLWVQAADDLASGASTVVLGWPHAPLYFAMASLASLAAAVMLRLAWLSLMSPSAERPPAP